LTRSLRRRHLALMVLLAILATALLVGAVAGRRPAPVMDQMPPGLGRSQPLAGGER
jgi:hypothetical protein